VSAAQLAADQSAVDAANAQQQAAQQNIDQAELLSPIAGTVQAVTIVAGDQVAASSTSETIVVGGVGGFEVITNVPVTSLPMISLGRQASVIPDGSSGHRRREGRRDRAADDEREQPDVPGDGGCSGRHRTGQRRDSERVAPGRRER